MINKEVRLVCRDCQESYTEKEFSLTCKKCNAPLRVTLPAEYLKEKLSQGFPVLNESSFLLDWFDYLPINSKEEIHAISLGEKESILLPSLRLGKKCDINNLYFKLEMGPTLSLKDRGTSLCVLKAKEFGRKTICLSSSGNNAASIAAYGSRANLSTVIFVQKDVSPAKLAKSMIYGAQVIMVDGDMAEASRLCAQMIDDHDWFQCGGPNPYRLGAKRMVAYGIVRQLGKAPDAILMPTGGGAGIVSVYDGFSELYEAGIISKMPRIICTQLAACNPIAQAYEQEKELVVPIQKKKSISDAIMNNNPYWGKYCLQAVKNTNGTCISVSDEEFIETIHDLADHEGLYAEPAGAVAVASAKKLKKMKGFEDVDTVVCTITGHGLNFPHATSNEYATIQPIEATPEAVLKKLNS